MRAYRFMQIHGHKHVWDSDVFFKISPTITLHDPFGNPIGMEVGGFLIGCACGVCYKYQAYQFTAA
jgi:hypothetical protein